MVQFSISSWSLHGLLGQARFELNEGEMVLQSGQAEGDLSLLALPAFIAEAGFNSLEICHFHFPSVETSYLEQLRLALIEHDVTLENVLIDTGNIAIPNESERQAEINFAKQWQTITAKVGGKGNRIDCGREEPTPTAIANSVNALKELVAHANLLGLHVTVENFHAMSREPEMLLKIMEKVAHPLKLCIDFGNAEYAADKFGTIKTLMPFGTSIHCKANYSQGDIDLEDLHRSLSYLKQANFEGLVSLIYGETEDEWERVLELRTAVSSYLNIPAP